MRAANWIIAKNTANPGRPYKTKLHWIGAALCMYLYQLIYPSNHTSLHLYLPVLHRQLLKQ